MPRQLKQRLSSGKYNIWRPRQVFRGHQVDLVDRLDLWGREGLADRVDQVVQGLHWFVELDCRLVPWVLADQVDLVGLLVRVDSCLQVL